MSKRRKTKKANNPPAPTVGRRKFPLAATLVLVFAVVGALGFWRMGSRPTETQPTVAAATETPGGQTPASEVGAAPEFQRLKGRWQRPDGGYIVEVKSVDDSGRMD